jgi:lysine 2,3-aminomutase
MKPLYVYQVRKEMEPFIKSKYTVPPSDDWHAILADSIVSLKDLGHRMSIDTKGIAPVIKRYPMRINPYYLSLISEKDDPVWKQAIPDERELNDPLFTDDPLNEEFQSPVPGLTHRYPDRVLFLVSNHCAMYCRHCMRKRKVGRPGVVTAATIDQGIDYITSNPAVKDVLLSGGDPLMLENEAIESLLSRLRRIKHLDIIRIHTRMPCTLPQRITPDLVNILKQFHPLYINTQFNHPAEITPQATAACALLANAGIPLGCQSVLLKGVNDDPAVMQQLMRMLLRIRVKPYYIHHGDPIKGTGHFRTAIETGIRIMKSLRGRISGMGVPHYMIDLPGGGGKVPLLPEYIIKKENGMLTVKNHNGEIFKYPVQGAVIPS